jgi:hypothetical protein
MYYSFQTAAKKWGMIAKILGITVVSAGFGAFMGLLISANEFNNTRYIDTNKSSKSQIKQHYFVSL